MSVPSPQEMIPTFIVSMNMALFIAHKNDRVFLMFAAVFYLVCIIIAQFNG